MKLGELIKSYVELVLRRDMGFEKVLEDSDGDYPFRLDSAACWVHVEAVEMPAIRVFAHAAFGLKRSAKLLGEINDMNVGHPFVKTSLVGDTVVVEYTMPWEAAEATVLVAACRTVGSVAAESGPMLAGVFGGRTPFPPGMHTDHNSHREIEDP